MAEETVIQQFNEGGVKGEMIEPSNNALERLLGNIPKKTTTSVTDVTETDDEIRIRQEKEANDLEKELLTRENANKTKEQQEIEAKKLEEEKKVEAARIIEENKNKTPQQIKEAEEIAAAKKAADTTNEESVINEFKSEFGDTEKEYEDSTEGLKEYFKDLTPLIEEEGKKKAIDELFTEFPVVGELAQHLAKGYGVESFQKKKEIYDYSKLEVKEDNTKLHEQLYRAALRTKGNDEEDINDLVETARDGGKLFDKAKASITVLDNLQKAEIEEIQKAEKAQSDAIAKQEAATLQEVDKILKSNTIVGLSFDGTKIKALREFGSTKDKDGFTERDKKWSSLTLEQQLLLDMIIMDDFKGIGAKTTVAATKAKSLSDLKKKADNSPKVDMTSSKNNEGLNKIKGNIKDILTGVSQN